MVLLYRSSSDSAALWLAELRRHIPELEMRVVPEIGNPKDIDAALVWKPPAGLLASLPNLKMIVSLGAGADHLLEDASLPRHVPVVRLVDPYMTEAMSEYVLTQVLRLHRQDFAYRAQQHARLWRELPQPNASERRVGVLGLGELGSDAARKLAVFGFSVGGWSRSERRSPGIESFHGREGLMALARRSDILVCLLPLTRETEGILDARLFAAMPKGAAIVNAARGRHLVEADLLAALESGQLSAAVLDVFSEEPLSPAHPFWGHPKIIMTPHAAAATHAPTAAVGVAENLRRLSDGRPLINVVDLARGY
ncbi:MAG TPA: glyoxylate/hydroxypyruvate reductase A [Stellaceae bacterium]|jgi:glyoxylate/hydroxypyruvate reductase A|nr:glyoxylate/hydroxypyruvate reductase A [Stellaceae bacterium]